MFFLKNKCFILFQFFSAHCAGQSPSQVDEGKAVNAEIPAAFLAFELHPSSPKTHEARHSRKDSYHSFRWLKVLSGFKNCACYYLDSSLTLLE